MGLGIAVAALRILILIGGMAIKNNGVGAIGLPGDRKPIRRTYHDGHYPAIS